MKYKLSTALGTRLLEIEGEAADEKAFFSSAQFWFDLPERCGNCGETHLVPVHRQPKGFDYFEIKCKSCFWALKFGQTKETHQLFPKGWEAPQSNNEA